jgi:biopolymer transport protein TolR
MSAPNVIPMADVMLVLLIIFMVVTPMLQKGFSVEMAKVPNPTELPDADKDDAIIVAVARDGSIYIGNTKTSKDQLTDTIKDQVSNRIDKTIFIRADQRAKYGDVAAVVDEIRNAGVDKVGLLTERVVKSTTAPGAPAGE